MKKVFTTMALAMLCTAGIHAQTGTTSTNQTKADANSGPEQHCLAQADEKTWSKLGLTAEQMTRVEEIRTRYKLAKHDDRGTENTMRGTQDDRATPTHSTSGTTGMDRTGTTGTDRTTGTTGTTGTDRAGTTGTTGTEPAGTTGTTGMDRTGTTGTTEKDHAGTTGTDHTKSTGTMGNDPHGTAGTTSGRSTEQLGYDDNHKESMERELRTVLTTAQFDSYQEWCQDQDAARGDRNMDMDR